MPRLLHRCFAEAASWLEVEEAFLWSHSLRLMWLTLADVSRLCLRAAASSPLRLAVFLALLARAACGPQWTTYIDSIFAEKGGETIRSVAADAQEVRV